MVATYCVVEGRWSIQKSMIKAGDFDERQRQRHYTSPFTHLGDYFATPISTSTSDEFQYPIPKKTTKTIYLHIPRQVCIPCEAMAFLGSIHFTSTISTTRSQKKSHRRASSISRYPDTQIYR